VLDAITNAHGPDAASFLALDLSDMASVRDAAGSYIAAGEPLHVLIDNAGLAGQRGLTTDGFELAFGVNHLGHFLFTTMLLDVLARSAPARVVVVASDSHYGAKGIDFEAVRRPTRTVTGLSEYAVSKLSNVLFAQELARRSGPGVTTYALHPGVIASDIWRRLPWPLESLATLFMKSTEQGARTSVYCATDPVLSGTTGRYYENCAERAPSEVATPELAAELWQRSEAWTAP
jgi:NAD(P)-dependent dehydrogenase (short-subunit alcohol dehydrogenase family)